MQISKRKVNPGLERQLFKMLFQLVADVKTAQEAEEVLKNLLSETELATVVKRLAVAYWLTRGRSYGNIKENLKVSSATIADVQQNLKRPGWKLAVKKVMADEWATVWEERIKKIIKR